MNSAELKKTATEQPGLIFGALLEKEAGETSEIVGSVLGFPISGLTGAMGYLGGSTPTKKEMKKQDERGLSNILLAGLGVSGYRMGKRLKYQTSKEKK